MTSTALTTRTFNGTPFAFRQDGWFNMTQAAKHFGKQLHHFWDAPDTLEYLDAVGKTSKSDELVEARRGNGGGTWAHPKLAVFFARWLDVRFAVWCDAAIDDILKGNAELVITKPQESAVMALPQDYSSALRALADAVDQQKVAQAKVQTLSLELADEKAISSVVVDRNDTLLRFAAHSLPNCNQMQLQKALSKLGYLRKSAGAWMPYAAWRKLFDYRVIEAAGRSQTVVIPTEEGKRKLKSLYLSNQLPMKKVFAV